MTQSSEDSADSEEGMQANEVGKPGSGDSSTATVPERADAGQHATRAARRVQALHPALQGLLALAAYLAVFIITYAAPLLRHPGVPLIAQTSPDPNFYIWSWQWWPYAISHGLNPLYSSQIGAPAGYDLAWTTPTAAVTVLLSPLTALIGPIASFNLTLVLAAPVSAWAAFVAARRLTSRFWAALAAGAVYGFSWYEVGETAIGHPNLCVTMLLPLMVYLALLWRDGKLGPRSFVALLAVAMAAEFYIFNETFFWMTVLWAALLLIGFVVARPAQRPEVVRLAKLVGVAWVIAMVLASPYLIYALLHAPAEFSKVLQPDFSLDLRDLVTPWSGIVLLVIVLALAVFAWRSRLTRLLVIGFVLVVALTVGPVLVVNGQVLGPVPWQGLWHLLFTRNTEPLRIIIFANLLLAMIVAVWLAMPARNRLLLASRWILGLAAIAGIIAYMPGLQRGYDIPAAIPAGNPAAIPAAAVQPTHVLPAFFTSGVYRDYLRRGETVVVVSDRANAGMLFQAYTNFYMRLSGGFINMTFTDRTSLPVPVAALQRPTPARERQFLAYARHVGVGAVIVERAWAEPWMNIFGRMGLHGTNVGGVTIYRT
jgi:hypothetical protein